MATGIPVGGEIIPILHPISGHPIPVFGPDDHGIEFKPGDGYNKRRRTDIDLGVFHWTGSENAIETMAETLRKRKLGIEYAISPYGSLYYFCDPMEVDTADAGIANARSWGVEIVNAGVRRANTLWREPQYRKVKMGPRTPYDTVIHGKKLRCWNFYPAQTMTAFALNKALVGAISTYPADVCTVPGVVKIKGNGAIVGACGHYNISEAKTDPGTLFMEELKVFMDTGGVPLANV